MSPYIFGVVVPLLVTLLVRNNNSKKPKRGVSVDVGGEPGLAIRNRRFESPVQSAWEGVATLAELFEEACKTHAQRLLVDTRGVLLREVETGHDGRSFEKLHLGDYGWLSYDRVFDVVSGFASGLTYIGHVREERAAIFADTRQEWFMALQLESSQGRIDCGDSGTSQSRLSDIPSHSLAAELHDDPVCRQERAITAGQKETVDSMGNIQSSSACRPNVVLHHLRAENGMKTHLEDSHLTQAGAGYDEGGSQHARAADTITLKGKAISGTLLASTDESQEWGADVVHERKEGESTNNPNNGPLQDILNKSRDVNVTLFGPNSNLGPHRPSTPENQLEDQQNQPESVIQVYSRKKGGTKRWAQGRCRDPCHEECKDGDGQSQTALGKEGKNTSVNNLSGGNKATTVICGKKELRTLVNISGQLDSVKRVIYMDDDIPSDASYIAYDWTITSFAKVVKLGSENSVDADLPLSADVAVIMYTSGSTGLPNGVMVTHGNVLATLSALMTIVPDIGTKDIYILHTYRWLIS
ncbi:hypothetical protein JHK84_040313 [Glycine max]|nr:hypothetical protein JHK85_040683 [Glycine max]KAG5121973.1 hypothetical protein JHK84_040313 [Glycine max]